MKNYFNFTIKARQMVPYFFYMIALVFGLAAIAILLGLEGVDEMTTIDGNYFLNLVGEALLGLLLMIGIMLLSLNLLANILKSVIYKEQPFEPDFDSKAWLWLIIKGSFLSFITFGIYTPWYVASVMRYFADNTSHAFNPISFRGKGGKLFSIIVLLLIVPLFFSIVLASLGSSAISLGNAGIGALLILIAIIAMVVAITFYQIYYYKWYLDFTYGSRRVVLGCKPGALFWTLLGETVLAMITLGIYLPMAILRIYRAFAREIVVGDKFIEARGGMSLRPWNDWAYCWGQILLSVITCWIYSPWAAMRIMRRFGSRLYFKSIDKPNETMPE